MDGAAALQKEVALHVARNPEPHPVAGTVDVFALEGRSGEVKVGRDPFQVALGEVNKALLAAALDAARLTFETKTFSH
jgi:hypothetical protein